MNPMFCLPNMLVIAIAAFADATTAASSPVTLVAVFE